MRIILKPGGVVLFFCSLAGLAAFALRSDRGSAAEVPHAVAATVGTLIGSDGGMEAEREGLPAGWGNLTQDKGTLRASRDTTAPAHTGAASLRLESVGGPATGNVAHALDPERASGRTVVVRGWVRSEGRLEDAQVAVFAQDAAYKSVLWGIVCPGPVVTRSREWTRFEGHATVPAGSRNVRLMLFLSGEGSAWLDDVTVEQSAAGGDTGPHR
jgi:hypothetical protein